MNAQGYLIYNLAYLTLYPKYDCWYQNGEAIPIDSDDYDIKCKPNYFCEESNGISWEVDWSNNESIQNWISKYGLNCASSLTISSFGMLYFSGFAVGSSFWPRQADFLGRKRFFIFTMLLQAISFLFITLIPAGPESNLSKYLWILQINMFFQGVCSSGRTAIGVVYMTELSPDKFHAMISSFYNFGEGIIYIYLTLFFKYSDHKNTKYTLWFGVAQNFAYLLVLVLIPESPKWLYQ